MAKLLKRSDRVKEMLAVSEVVRRRKPNLLMRKHCWMCLHIYSAKPSENSRYCIIGRKNTTKDDVACSQFSINTHFWCRERQQYIDFEACSHVRKRKREDRSNPLNVLYKDCRISCKQGKLVEWIIEKEGLPDRKKIFGSSSYKSMRGKKLLRRTK